jgi:L-cysteine:1D-myo-inositol 2-amino-2-deoxy-alpha-D-glucopyranoside ligase
VDKLRTQFDPRVIRLGLIEHHYRFEWEWNAEMFAQNIDRLARWGAGSQIDGGELLEQVRKDLDNDLDTPSAIAHIDRASEMGVNVGAAASLLGVDLAR